MDDGVKEEPVLATLNPLPVTPILEEDYDVFDPGFECIKRKANMSTTSVAPWCESSQRLRKNKLRIVNDSKRYSLNLAPMCYHSSVQHGILSPCDACLAESSNVLWNKKFPMLSHQEPISELTSDPELLPKFAVPLPVTKARSVKFQDDHKPIAFPVRISPRNVVTLIKNQDTTQQKLLIIDCRYPFEYHAGHIQGAVNIYLRSKLLQMMFQEDSPAEQNRMTLIFHCEFSSHRAPTLCRFLREADYELNFQRGCLNYPDIYLITGGYKNFFSLFRTLCTPQNYTSMWDPEFDGLRQFYSTLKSSDFTNVKNVGIRKLLEERISVQQEE